MLSSYVFAPKSNERGAAVTLTLTTAYNGSAHDPCTDVPIKYPLCKESRKVWKYTTANRVKKKLPVALTARAEVIAVSAFHAPYDVNPTAQETPKQNCRGPPHGQSPHASSQRDGSIRPKSDEMR